MAKRNDGLGEFVLGMLAFGAVLYGADQHGKRKAEQQQYRQSLEQLTAILAHSEAELADLRARFGPKNEQVLALAAEVERLREQINSRRAA